MANGNAVLFSAAKLLPLGAAGYYFIRNVTWKSDLTESQIYLDQNMKEMNTDLKGNIKGVEKNLKEDVKQVKEDLKSDIKRVEKNLKEDIKQVKEDLKSDINGIRSDINGIRSDINGIRTDMEHSNEKLTRLIIKALKPDN